MKTNLLLPVLAIIIATLSSCVIPPPMPPPPCMVRGGGQPEFDPGFNGLGYNPRFRDNGQVYFSGPPQPIGIIPGTGVNIYGDAAASVVDPRRCWGPPLIRHFDDQQRTARHWGE